MTQWLEAAVPNFNDWQRVNSGNNQRVFYKNCSFCSLWEHWIDPSKYELRNLACIIDLENWIHLYASHIKCTCICMYVFIHINLIHSFIHLTIVNFYWKAMSINDKSFYNILHLLTRATTNDYFSTRLIYRFSFWLVNSYFCPNITCSNLYPSTLSLLVKKWKEWL